MLNFFPIEAPVSPCLSPLLLLKYFGIKKEKINKKDYIALAPYPEGINSNPKHIHTERDARAEP
jgi:hypothetical protein